MRASALLLLLSTFLAPPAALAATIPVHVVVVTTFELGQDSGDAPGEFQAWVERLPLKQVITAPATYHKLYRYNSDLKVLGIVLGEGPEHASSAITALLSDPRFDLRHAYFVLAGIAGIDPKFGSLGSAVWAPHVINGGLAHAIDPREIPADWPDGFTPIQGGTPAPMPVPPLHSVWGDMSYTIDPGLLAWAYNLTRGVALRDSAELQKTRSAYTGFPKALTPPMVAEGDTLASPTFWVGAKLNDWARRWVSYWTQGQGVFATTAEEDLGFMQALALQAQAGRADMRRVLVLRTASDYDMPPPGGKAADLLQTETAETGYSGYQASLEAAYLVASPVVKELATHWDRYRNQVP